MKFLRIFSHPKRQKKKKQHSQASESLLWCFFSRNNHDIFQRNSARVVSCQGPKTQRGVVWPWYVKGDAWNMFTYFFVKCHAVDVQNPSITLRSVVSPVIQRFLASPWWGNFIQGFHFQLRHGNLWCHPVRFFRRRSSCANVNVGQVTLLEDSNAFRQWWGYVAGRPHQGNTSTRIHLEKKTYPLIIFCRFLLFKKNPEKIRACNYAENKKPCFCLHPVLKEKTVLPEVHLTSHREFQVA